MPLLTSLFAINPEVEKHNLINTTLASTEDVNLDEDIIDLKLCFNYFHRSTIDRMDFLKDHLLNIFTAKDEETKISPAVLSQSFSLLDSLYPSILEDIEIDNINSTSYGTVIFDWEKNQDNVFSLEVGADMLGYFIEVEGKDIKQVDSVNLDESKTEILEDLSVFLSK